MFEIKSADEVGMFEVSAKFMGVAMEKVELVFQVRALWLLLPNRPHPYRGLRGLLFRSRESRASHFSLTWLLSERAKWENERARKKKTNKTKVRWLWWWCPSCRMGLLLLLGDFVEDSRAQWQVKDVFYKCMSPREIVFFLDKNLPYFHANILDTIGFRGTLGGKSAEVPCSSPGLTGSWSCMPQSNWSA